jgi:cytochrome c oxidase subunit I+III
MKTEPSATAVGPEDDAILVQAWASPGGIGGWLRAVNHKNIGRRFIFTAFAFLLIGGIEALLLRIQLGTAENTFLDAETYNQIFTMHGTTMMFLFIIPMVEGLGMYLIPLMIGTRDLPFPRLNAFGYWTYLFGGLFVYSSFLTGNVPDGGWFAYVPLTGPEFSPGRNMDFWLLGVTFVEIAAIVGAVELIYVILFRRAPGMSLNRMPIFGWAMLVTGFMILFAFPVLLAASVLLEAERVFGLRLFDGGAGGDPLLWQHLFWIFGHPEVYVMFIPAAGVASMVIPVMSRRPIAGYSYIVAATIATGILSFGLWVHHMFTTGLSFLAFSVFAATSVVIAIPNGVQVFAWIGTIWRGRPRFNTPMLFMIGFLILFVIGGITGVMVASVPFDQQVHDSFFVVAHFHYVLIGGVVFPIFAGLHYWWPKFVGGRPSEGLGKTSFWLMFIGFNVTFFPQHWLGMAGMPRRIYTYPAGLGWDLHNLISTVGAGVLALGVLVFTVNLIRSWIWRPPMMDDDPWEANTLEWAAASPPTVYNFRVLPAVGSADPLWDLEPIAIDDEATRTAIDQLSVPKEPFREVIETSPVDAQARSIERLPGPSWWPLLVAASVVVGLAGILIYSMPLFLVGLALTLVTLGGWGASSALPRDNGEEERALPIDRGRTGVTGLYIGFGALAAMLVSFVYGYFSLIGQAEAWPPPEVPAPSALPLVVSLLLLVVALVAVGWARGGVEDQDDVPRLSIGLGATVVASLAAGLIALGAVMAAPVPAEHSAYTSITAVLIVTAGLTALAAAGIAAVALWHGARGRYSGYTFEPVRAVQHFSVFALVSVAVLFAIVWIVPRVVLT